jgi:hypothetical protein
MVPRGDLCWCWGLVWLALLVVVSLSWCGLFRGPVGAVSSGSFCWLLSLLSTPAVKKTALSLER